MSRQMLKGMIAAALVACAPVAIAQDKKADRKADKAEKVAAAPAAAPAKEGQALKNALALCQGCHGIPGYKTAFPETYHVPKIAGQNPAYIVAALKAYKDGSRSHPSMRGIAASLTDEDMKRLADYYGGAK